MKINFKQVHTFLDSWGVIPGQNIPYKIHNKMLEQADGIDKRFAKFISFISSPSPGLKGMYINTKSFDSIRPIWLNYKKMLRTKRKLFALKNKLRQSFPTIKVII